MLTSLGYLFDHILMEVNLQMKYSHNLDNSIPKQFKAILKGIKFDIKREHHYKHQGDSRVLNTYFKTT